MTRASANGSGRCRRGRGEEGKEGARVFLSSRGGSEEGEMWTAGDRGRKTKLISGQEDAHGGGRQSDSGRVAAKFAHQTEFGIGVKFSIVFTMCVVSNFCTMGPTTE